MAMNTGDGSRTGSMSGRTPAPDWEIACCVERDPSRADAGECRPSDAGPGAWSAGGVHAPDGRRPTS
jgi:hypothetical protein